jgi:putative endonuclease
MRLAQALMLIVIPKRRVRFKDLVIPNAERSGGGGICPEQKSRGIWSVHPMAREKRYYVYILASISGVLYVGVTGFLYARVLQHKSGETDGFTRHYRVHKLVYYETFRYVNHALARETEIKKWRREKKVALIEAQNPTWKDLAADWGKPAVMRRQIPPASASLGVGMTRS